MTSRSLFNIIVKIYGLFLLKEALVISGNFISAGILVHGEEAQLFFLTNLIPFFVYVAATFICLLHSDLIVRKLNITKDVEENIAFNVHSSTVTTIAIFILSGYVIANELPQICQYFFWYYRDKVYSNGQQADMSPKLAVSLGKIAIALLLLRYRRSIVAVIERNKK